MLTAASFFSLTNFAHKELFETNSEVWSGLQNLKEYMNSLTYPDLSSAIKPGSPLADTLVYYDGKLLPGDDLSIQFDDATKGKLKVLHKDKILEGASVLMAGAVLAGDRILLGKGVLVESGAFIKSPAIIGDRTEIRQGAYLRGYCLAGAGCVIGHVTEVKHTIFLDDAKAGHFAYLGDSILGNEVNLGAGTKLANLRFLGGEVQVRTAHGTISTGLRKLGAILGDQTQTGCNSVTNPGALLGPKSMVMPNTTVGSGYHEKGSLIR